MSILIQVRLPEAQVKMLDDDVKEGKYATRSEAIRDALRAQRWGAGTLPDTGDSVEEVRAIRKKLSKMHLTAAEINDIGIPLGELLRRRSAGTKR